MTKVTLFKQDGTTNGRNRIKPQKSSELNQTKCSIRRSNHATRFITSRNTRC